MYAVNLFALSVCDCDERAKGQLARAELAYHYVARIRCSYLNGLIERSTILPLGVFEDGAALVEVKKEMLHIYHTLACRFVC